MDDPTNPEPAAQPGEQQHLPLHDAWRMPDPVAEPPSADHVVAPPAFEATGSPGAPEVAAEPTPTRGWRAASRGQRVLALGAAGVLVAGGVAVAVATSSGASDSGTTTNAAGQLPGGLTQQPQSGGQAPDGSQGFGVPGGGPGGVDGEEHVAGTVRATTGSTVTVRATDGTTATYTVTSDTQVVRDGAQATLSDVQVGDAVLVHVLPTTSGGHRTAERLFAGTLPAGFGGAVPGGPGAGASSGSGADTT